MMQDKTKSADLSACERVFSSAHRIAFSFSFSSSPRNRQRVRIASHFRRRLVSRSCRVVRGSQTPLLSPQKRPGGGSSHFPLKLSEREKRIFRLLVASGRVWGHLESILIAKEWFWLSPLAKRTAVPAHDTAAPAHRTAVPAHRLAALAYRTAVPAQETVAVAHEMPFQATKLLC